MNLIHYELASLMNLDLNKGLHIPDMDVDAKSSEEREPQAKRPQNEEPEGAQAEKLDCFSHEQGKGRAEAVYREGEGEQAQVSASNSKRRIYGSISQNYRRLGLHCRRLCSWAVLEDRQTVWMIPRS